MRTRGIATVTAAVLASAGWAAPVGTAGEPAAGSSSPRGDDSATFTLSSPVDADAKDGPVVVSLNCGDTVAARAVLVPERSTQRTVPRRDLEGECRVAVRSAAHDGVTDEVAITVETDAGVVERHTSYTGDSDTTSRPFPLPSGDVTIDVAVGSMPADEVGTPLTVMAFNIWLGGRLEGRHEHGFEDQNLQELLEFIQHENPDVLFAVETYGAGELIEQALAENQPEGREFTGIQITREPGQEPDRDNLWMFTWLDVEEIYPLIDGDELTSFNFGGARLGLPDGGHVHAFSTWLWHADNSWSPTTQSAMETAMGIDRTYTDADLVATDDFRRMAMARELIDERLDEYVGAGDAPVIIGGDMNTQSHLDWSEQFADAAGHEGMVLDWPVMRAFDEAGFVDSYRYANPDAARYPGRTWAPAHSFMYSPTRIDYILTRGQDVRVLGSSTRTQRLPEHQGSELDSWYPFYSDHGAVVTELLIRGDGPGPDGTADSDPPESGDPIAWPDEPAGRPVPPSELTAIADSETPGSAGRAVDGDPRTIWHSRTTPDPPDTHPHALTVDLGQERVLSAVRYQPRLNGFNGIVTEYELQVSDDGETFHPVASGTWARDSLPKDIDLTDVDARYLRFVSEFGVGGYTAVGELIPYEQES
ncbi:discoidin domain-containing protein [Phytoactinopolyspora endophytica]|uniref:discoidin domain-containing protein n=1 Tax=Phytoactinopolyspora endophytica TaxID=1642495 RepID=UPI00101DD172|nr:discoidin domain-containing protein [Phytoactinopolyspora endophytica]